MKYVYRLKDGTAKCFASKLDATTAKTLGCEYVGLRKELEAREIIRRKRLDSLLECELQDAERAIMDDAQFMLGEQDCRLGRIPAHRNDDVYMKGFEMQSSYEHCLSQIGFNV